MGKIYKKKTMPKTKQECPYFLLLCLLFQFLKRADRNNMVEQAFV